MESKQFDQYIKQQLESFESPLQEGHWDTFEQKLKAEDLTQDALFEDDMIEQMRSFSAAPIPGDWDVMSNLLDEAEGTVNEQFDKDVKTQVDRFEAPYNHTTWPILAKRLEEAEATRKRLYVAKVLELACILLFLMTLVNFYPQLNEHVIKPAADKFKKDIVIGQYAESQSADINTPTDQNIEDATLEGKTPVSTDLVKVSSSVDSPVNELTSAASSANLTSDNIETISHQAVDHNQATVKTATANTAPATNTNLSQTVIPTVNSNKTEEVSFMVQDKADEASDATKFYNSELSELGQVNNQITGDLASSNWSSAMIPTLTFGLLDAPIFNSDTRQNLFSNVLPTPSLKKKVRFGIRSSADVNILYFPEDKFYSDGNKISFDDQHLPAFGYGGGFSIGWFGKRVGYEVGLLYSSKSFKPGRQLLIGEPLRNSKVDFASVQIDVISVPFHVNYYAKASGKFRVYVIGGMDLSLISQANYDLNIKNNYPRALSIQTDPNALASTREARRIREHILDGAEFSSKSFVTAHAGFGLERYLNPKLSLFAEPTYIYQVPFGFLNNRNGKHLQSVSLHLGARLPIN